MCLQCRIRTALLSPPPKQARYECLEFNDYVYRQHLSKSCTRVFMKFGKVVCFVDANSRIDFARYAVIVTVSVCRKSVFC